MPCRSCGGKTPEEREAERSRRAEARLAAREKQQAHRAAVAARNAEMRARRAAR